MTHIWTILLRYGSSRKKIKITGNSGESSIVVYKKAKEMYVKLKDKLPSGTSVNFYSCTQQYAPSKDKKPGRGQMWCPQCAKYSNFFMNEELGVRKCFICGISDQDFYVKKYNHIWKAELAGIKSQKKQEQLRRRIQSESV